VIYLALVYRLKTCPALVVIGRKAEGFPEGMIRGQHQIVFPLPDKPPANIGGPAVVNNEEPPGRGRVILKLHKFAGHISGLGIGTKDVFPVSGPELHGVIPDKGLNGLPLFVRFSRALPGFQGFSENLPGGVDVVKLGEPGYGKSPETKFWFQRVPLRPGYRDAAFHKRYRLLKGKRRYFPVGHIQLIPGVIHAHQQGRRNERFRFRRKGRINVRVVWFFELFF
jgi:hypothetical protein